MTRAMAVGLAMLALGGCIIEEGEQGEHDCSRCGDGVVDDAEQCDDGNIYNADGCSASCEIEPRCGDGKITAGEACDDGNSTNGDACEADCTLPRCGNGIVDTGEQCDDGNDASGDGCTPTCMLPPFSTTQPALVSGALTACTTAASHAGRKVAIDGQYNAYVVMSCTGEPRLATSIDHGQTWSAPKPLGLGSVSELAVQGGPASVAYIAAVTFDSRLLFTRSTDAGQTWSAAVTLATDVKPDQVSIATFGDAVYVQVSTFDGFRRIYRNPTQGSGMFYATTVSAAAVFHDVLVDDAGRIWSAGDDPSFRLAMSSDGGATFGAEINPPGTAYYSDWSIGNGTLFAVGSNGELDLIPIANPATSTTVTGLQSFDITPDVRALSTDRTSGTAFIVSQTFDGSIVLDRLRPNTTSLDSASHRTLATGTSAGIVAVSDRAALIAFTRNGQIYATVQAY